MKALSIRQPWAALIADSHKRFETRSWHTSYRGPLLICSSQKRIHISRANNLVYAIGLHPSDYNLWFGLPYGKALCIVDLAGIYKTEGELLYEFVDYREKALGDYSPGRFAWELTNVRRFKEPWPVRGRLGLFEVPDEEIKKYELEEKP